MVKLDSGTEINHRDGNKNNNCVTNLEYVTHKSNMSHAIAHGLFSAYEIAQKGEKHWNAKLTESDVREIRASTLAAPALASHFDVSKAMIYRIRKRQSWRATA